MNMRRVWSITFRHLRQTIKDVPRLSMLFYWAFIELVLIGFMGKWVDASSSHLVSTSLIAAAVAWSLVVRASLEIPWNMLEELWAHNLVNLFASPLSVIEWMASAALYAGVSFLCLLLFLCGCAYSMFGYNFLSTGWILIPLLCNYYLSALCIGFLTAALLVRYGVRMTSYVFMISWVFAPLSGIYYSLSVLPIWAQYTAYMLPTYYGVDMLKTIVLTGETIYWKLGAACVLNVLYLVLACVLFKGMFEQSRQESLARLVN